MSTRSILRERRRFFIHLQRKGSDNPNLSKSIAEIDFIFEKLKEYDKRETGNTEGDN